MADGDVHALCSAVLQPAQLVVLQFVARAFDFDQLVALLGRPEPDQVGKASAIGLGGVQQTGA